MSLLFGWVPCDAGADARSVVESMSVALGVTPAQQCHLWTEVGLGIGVLEPPSHRRQPDDLGPASTPDGRFTLWMAGEAIASGDSALTLSDVGESRTRSFRRALLDRWLGVGVETIRQLDGEYHIAIWDARDRALMVLNDRFGGLPMYWAQSDEGIAFGGGVRGVLVAPGIRCAPDPEALREAVTFGGYRLGGRTNVCGVQMVRGATVQTIRPQRRAESRYWSWRDIAPRHPSNDIRDVVAELHTLWQRAISRRLAQPARYGQTLSGGLDSRAILAEAAPRVDWTAITYGLQGCDDAIYAQRAAAAVGATWLFQPLYAGDWLSERAAHVQHTDGLIALGDLMHLESLELQREHFDVHISGYLGDAVSGPAFADVATVEQTLVLLPYYGAPVSLDYQAALSRVRSCVDALDGASPRFAIFEQKLPQSTNRWTAAWRPWLRVRKPFVDYAFFDFCQGLPPSVRTTGRLHERWLRAAYPGCFRTIPNQRTGMPVLTPAWREQAARVMRKARGTAFAVLPGRIRPRLHVRSYHDDGHVWRQPEICDRIFAPILRPDSLTCEILGRRRVTDLLDGWRREGAAPAQVVGAMFIYELYHRELAATLRLARSHAGRTAVLP